VRARYEEELIRAALSARGLELEPSPDGKLIESVVVHANPVILRGDFPLSSKIPWTWLNALHVRTRERILTQELLLGVGRPFDPRRFEETGRNLRSLFILSVARLVPCKGSAPDRVVILVVTKDQWSLRLNTEFALDQARLDSLSFSLSEGNVGGLNKSLSINFVLDPGRYLVGLGWSDPRIAGSRHALSLAASLLIGRIGPTAGGYEGLSVSASVGRPLYSLSTRWAWLAAGSYLSDIARLFQGGELAVQTFDGVDNARSEWSQSPVRTARRSRPT
jgi:hypothetical protein